MSLYHTQFEYHPVTPKLDRPIPTRPLPSSFYNTTPNYNAQTMVTPAVQIGHHTYVPPREDDSGSMQPPGREIDEPLRGASAMRNVAGYVKPGYTLY